MGSNSRIGSGSVVVKEVPPNSVVVGIPGQVTHRDGKRVDPRGADLNMTDLPDPVARALKCLAERVRDLERQIDELKHRPPPPPMVTEAIPISWGPTAPPDDRQD